LEKILFGLAFSIHGRGDEAYKIMTLAAERKMLLGRLGVNRSKALK
jgi:hypothetical protein